MASGSDYLISPKYSAQKLSTPSADFNASGSLQVQDIFDFLAAWFTGCP